MARTKISKVAKDLNVALPTVIEFLRKKDITVDDNPNARIEDDVYELLIHEFKSDKDLKSRSEQIASDRQKERARMAPKETPKPQPEAQKEEVKLFADRPQPKILGKIDLDASGKPTVKPVEKPQPAPEPEIKPEPEAEVQKPAETPAEPEVREEKPAPAPEPKAEVQQPKEETAPKQPAVKAPEPAPEPVKPQQVKVEQPKPQPKPQPAPAPKAEPKPAAEAPAKEEPKAAAPAPAQEEEVFRLHTVNPIPGPQINVIGKIDLSALNQSTAPKRSPRKNAGPSATAATARRLKAHRQARPATPPQATARSANA